MEDTRKGTGHKKPNNQSADYPEVNDDALLGFGAV
jgi:hypothetical protein